MESGWGSLSQGTLGPHIPQFNQNSSDVPISCFTLFELCEGFSEEAREGEGGKKGKRR